MRTQRRIHYRFWTGLLAALSVGIIFSSAAMAESPAEGITLSPVDKHYTIDAGSSTQDTLTILNDGQTAYDFVVYGAPYWVKDTQYTPDFATQQPNADAYK